MAEKYKATAVREGKKYSGVFLAENREEALKKLSSQGYEVLSIEPVKEYSRYLWITAAFLGALVFFAFLFLNLSTDKNDASIKKSGKILKQWVKLKSGSYLIATSRPALEKALSLRQAGHKDELKKMMTAKEVGFTNKFGGGFSAFIAEWDKTSHAVQIKFKDNPTICWVEERAVLG